MPDAHQDMRHILAAAGLDLAAIRTAMTETRTREERAVALVRAFRALRQRDLAQLMDMSSAAVSRLVSVLLAAGSVREQAFKDGAVGRPTDWLLAPKDAPSNYQQRQVIIASLPDIIANLNTTPSSAVPLSLPVYTAVEESPISVADPPAYSALNVPPVSHEEPSAQMALALWFGRVSEDSGACAETNIVRSVADEMPPIGSADERFVPLPPTATYVLPPIRSRSQSPIPPWERSQYRVRSRWWSHALIRHRAAGLAHGMGQLLRLMPRLIMMGGRLLWASLRVLSRGIQKLVWLIDDLNDIVVGRRWLLLGIAVSVAVGVLVGLRRQSDAIRSSVAAAPAEMTPTVMAPTVLVTAVPVQVRRAEIVGTGKGGLIVRDAPAGKRIGKLANGVAVIILAGPQTIVNQEDSVWWQVQHGDLVGWASARFLKLLDTP